MANVARDAFANRHHLIELLVERRPRRQLPERDAGALPDSGPRSVIVEDADGVDERARFLGSLQNLRQPACAGIVAAIADDDENFPVAACRPAAAPAPSTIAS